MAGQALICIDTPDGTKPVTGDTGGSIPTSSSPNTGMVSGSVTCTLANTAYALGSSTACEAVIVTADEANTGNVIMGDSGITTAGVGVPKPSTAPTNPVPIDDIAKIYVASSVGGDVVQFVYFTRI